HIGGALNQPARAALGDYATRRLLQANRYVMLLLLEGEDVRMEQAWKGTFLAGLDTDIPFDPSDDFSGQEPFRIDVLNLDDAGRPILSLTGAAPAGMLAGRGDAVSIPVPFRASWEQHDFKSPGLAGILTSDADGPTSLHVRLCGADTAASLHRFIWTGGFGGPDVLDLIAVGAHFASFQIDAIQPDIDVDGDGLERFMDTDGDQIVDLCIDGNGAQISGEDCPLDPRIADAYSLTVDLAGVRALLAGRTP